MARAKTPANGSSARPAWSEESDPVFSRAVGLARAVFGGDVGSIVTLVDEHSAWRNSDPEGRLPPEAPGVRVVVQEGRGLWVEDARQDPRFRDQAVVTGPPHIRFYAAAPIRLENGAIPGALSVGGPTPRAYDAELAERLQDLADFIADEWGRINANRAREAFARDRDAAHETLAAIVGAAPMPLVITDNQFRVIGASPRWREVRAPDAGEVRGRTLFELAPEVFEPYREGLSYCLGGEAVSLERLKLPRRGGGVDWLQVEVTPWREPTGAVGGVIITSHDITHVIEALERAERSEERLKLALEIADVHVWEMDYSRSELIKAGAEDTFFDRPRTYQDMIDDVWGGIDPRDLAEVQAQWAQHEADGTPYRPEHRTARDDGQEVWAAGAARLFTDEDGQVRLLGAFQNITERKAQERALVKAKEEAEAANAAKSTFLATMSHEIRTPLNGVLGMAQAMAMGELTDQQRGRLEVVRQSGEQLLAILNDVLDLSKIEAGKLELEQVEFDIGELAKGAHATFSAVAESKGLDFSLKIEPAARGAWLGDSVRVRQILYNLVSNALKFTETGEVAVTVGRRGGALKLTVRDTGIGIAPEKLSHLFQKFEQADASTTRRYGGTGLGLAICRDLAELMGGKIGASSTPGEGATFSVSLPLAKMADEPRRRAKARPAAQPLDASQLRVLAAEDNDVNQLVLKTLLAQVGVEPVIVRNGKAAVEAWAAEPWDLILMDVQMPEMDGPSATAVIRTRELVEGRPRTPIIALTANTMDHHIAEYMEAGMDGFIAKPVEAGRLFAAIQGALATAAAASAGASKVA